MQQLAHEAQQHPNPCPSLPMVVASTAKHILCHGKQRRVMSLDERALNMTYKPVDENNLKLFFYI
jgi:hypothetical protein